MLARTVHVICPSLAKAQLRTSLSYDSTLPIKIYGAHSGPAAPLRVTAGRRSLPKSGAIRVYSPSLRYPWLAANVEKNAEAMRQDQAVMTERNQTMRVLTASIAHELRTPFATIEGIAQTLKQNMSKLLKQSKQVKPSKAGDDQLSEAMIAYLEKKDLGGSLSNVVKRSHTFVNMMQQKISYGALDQDENKQVFTVLQQIQVAIESYSMELEELDRVKVNVADDFQAEGTSLLLQHVILNLLKNALFYTHSDPNAQIDIWLEQGDVINKLHFKDTGRGIKPEDLPYIFDAFFSKTIHGTGVGLAFCKMVIERNFNGSISCDSVLGEYTHFVIELPLVKG